jgi:SAM-dependent methyltransferase
MLIDNTSERWKKYYEAIGEREARDTLFKALEIIECKTSLSAIDIGCGNGIDTVELLKRGWKVLALDKEAHAIELIRKRVISGNLQTLVCTFEDMILPNGVDLINASYSLPFCRPDKFREVWTKITAALKPKGYFTGHFFGPNDDWAQSKDMTFFSYEKLIQLFKEYDIINIEETEEDKPTAISSELKHWHVFKVLLRKT